ncbi:MAG: flagellar motor switch protein FliG [Armatimonadota bacterium]
MTQEYSVTQLSGIEKASLFLIALGSKTAGDVLQHLPPDIMQKLCAQIARHKSVDPLLQQQVLQDFNQLQHVSQAAGGVEYVQEILEQALGPTKAKEILGEITAGSGGRPFDWLKASGASRLANCLQNERPQIIALVLAHLSADKAADVIALLPEELQGKVAYRLTSMQPVAPEIVELVEEMLKSKLSMQETGDLKAVGGLQSLVTILNNSDRQTEGRILQFLEQEEEGMAEDVRQMMFVFEDIVNLDDRALQTIIRELDQEDIRLGLKGASEEIKALFFRNMSERAAEALKEDLEMMGAVKRRDVETAQRHVVLAIRRLDEAGTISLRQDEEDVIA